MEIQSFLATVENTFLELPEEKKIDLDNPLLPFYNDNKNYIESKSNIEFLGSIKFKSTKINLNTEHIAFPFDKNNVTYPIVGETVLILKIQDIFYWLPYSISLYPNYRENASISILNTNREGVEINKSNKNAQYKSVKDGIPNSQPIKRDSQKSSYTKNEKIKFIKPYDGDTIISGRVGNSIRFSEFFLTEDGKTSSAGIFIRNRQNSELDSKPIGTLVEEDINKDGTSIYMTSNKTKVPFLETVKKQKVAFTEYPNSSDLTGDQFFINSDRIVLSAKAKEFIIFGKGNTGIITDGKYSVDALKEIYLHSEKDITIHSKGANNIFVNSENGKIYLGKNRGEGDAGADVQKMVLGGELVKILQDLIDTIAKQQYLTPAGPSATGPVNVAQFNAIKSRLKNILSAKNYLSKS